MLKLIRELLLKIVDDIDCGNSNASNEELIEIAKVLQSFTDKTQRMSKYQACKYLRIGRSTFDSYVRSGQLPRGKKEAGWKELSWFKKDLDLFVEERKERMSD